MLPFIFSQARPRHCLRGVRKIWTALQHDGCVFGVALSGLGAKVGLRWGKPKLHTRTGEKESELDSERGAPCSLLQSASARHGNLADGTSNQRYE